MKSKKIDLQKTRREFLWKVFQKTGQVTLASGFIYAVTAVTDRKDLVAGAT